MEIVTKQMLDEFKQDLIKEIAQIIDSRANFY